MVYRTMSEIRLAHELGRLLSFSDSSRTTGRFFQCSTFTRRGRKHSSGAPGIQPTTLLPTTVSYNDRWFPADHKGFCVKDPIGDIKSCPRKIKPWLFNLLLRPTFLHIEVNDSCPRPYDETVDFLASINCTPVGPLHAKRFVRTPEPLALYYVQAVTGVCHSLHSGRLIFRQKKLSPE